SRQAAPAYVAPPGRPSASGRSGVSGGGSGRTGGTEVGRVRPGRRGGQQAIASEVLLSQFKGAVTQRYGVAPAAAAGVGRLARGTRASWDSLICTLVSVLRRIFFPEMDRFLIDAPLIVSAAYELPPSVMNTARVDITLA